MSNKRALGISATKGANKHHFQHDVALIGAYAHRVAIVQSIAVCVAMAAGASRLRQLMHVMLLLLLLLSGVGVVLLQRRREVLAELVKQLRGFACGSKATMAR